MLVVQKSFDGMMIVTKISNVMQIAFWYQDVIVHVTNG